VCDFVLPLKRWNLTEDEEQIGKDLSTVSEMVLGIG